MHGTIVAGTHCRPYVRHCTVAARTHRDHASAIVLWWTGRIIRARTADRPRRFGLLLRRSLRGLLGCSSVEECDFWYSALMRVPETAWVTPDRIEELLASRKGLSRGDMKEIRGVLQQLYRNRGAEEGKPRQGSMGGVGVSGTAGGSREGERGGKGTHRRQRTLLGLFGRKGTGGEADK